MNFRGGGRFRTSCTIHRNMTGRFFYGYGDILKLARRDLRGVFCFMDTWIHEYPKAIIQDSTLYRS
jgi:hypothetical protein